MHRRRRIKIRTNFKIKPVKQCGVVGDESQQWWIVTGGDREGARVREEIEGEGEGGAVVGIREVRWWE